MSEDIPQDFKPHPVEPIIDDSPLEPDDISTERVDVDVNDFCRSVIERIRTPGTAGKITITKEDNTEPLIFSVDEEGVIHDLEGRVINLSPDPLDPSKATVEEIIIPEDHEKKPIKKIIGAATVAAIILAIGGAKLISSHKRDNLG